MKYESNEALEMIFEKSKEIRVRRECRRTAILASATAALTVLLIATVILLKGQTISEASASHLGAFLLPSEAGGYVLIGVAAFILGFLVAAFAFARRRQKKERKEKP